MFLKNAEQITQAIQQVHFAIFELPKTADFPTVKTAINITPNDKNHISIEAVHDLEQIVRTKQSTALIITIHHADRMTQQAQNCFLKLLEEPGSNIHFVFFTHHANQLLATVRSRAHLFELKQNIKIDTPPTYDKETIALAKQYISIAPQQLVSFSQTLSKDRGKTLEVLDAAIELLYKSYFKTGNAKFLDKLTKLTKTHDRIAQNGHVRLQLIAGMV